MAHTSDECFYIETKLNDTIHVIYQVLRGGDFNVDMIINDPLGNTVFTQPNVGFGWYSDQSLKIAGLLLFFSISNSERLNRHVNHFLSGTYRACFNNRQYFNAKVIYLGVLAVHEDLLLEAAMSATDEKRKNQTAVVDEFSERVMVKRLKNLNENRKITNDFHLEFVSESDSFVLSDDCLSNNRAYSSCKRFVHHRRQR